MRRKNLNWIESIGPLFLAVMAAVAATQSAGAEDAPLPPPPADNTTVQAPPPEGAASASANAATSTIEIPSAGTNTTPSESDPNSDSLSQAVEEGKSGHFTGKPITLQVRDAEIADILRLISEASGFNIVIGDDVRGKLTLSLVDVPWDQALDVVLHTMKLGAERNNNLLRISTLASLTAEKQAEIAAKTAALAATPKITRIFQISYADASALSGVLRTIFSAGGGLGPGGNQQNTNGTSAGIGGATRPPPSSSGSSGSSPNINTSTMQVDSRTNSIVVEEVPDNMERIAKLIKVLDTATPQILIEAKVIEGDEQFQNQVNGGLGFGSSATASNQFFGSFMAANPIDPLIGSPGVLTSGSTVPGTGSTGSFGFSPSISFIPGLARLNATLNLAVSDSQNKLLSSPKVVVQNKQPAQITQSTPVGMVNTTAVAGVGTQNAVTITQANLSLSVTPTVTANGEVIMVLNMERDVPQLISVAGQQVSAVANRNMQTQVSVESGSTLVIGGVYDSQVNHTDAGFPILKDIPILGALFGNKSDTTFRTELFFFITPRILNPKEAGLSG